MISKKENYPLRIKISRGFGEDGFIVRRFHYYLTTDPIATVLSLMKQYQQYEAVINGIRFEGATKGSVDVAIGLFFKKYKILEKCI